MTYREELTQKISSLKEINTKKRDLQSKIKAVSEELDSLEGEKR
jgi:hypothetical protein